MPASPSRPPPRPSPAPLCPLRKPPTPSAPRAPSVLISRICPATASRTHEAARVGVPLLESPSHRSAEARRCRTTIVSDSRQGPLVGSSGPGEGGGKGPRPGLLQGGLMFERRAVERRLLDLGFPLLAHDSRMRLRIPCVRRARQCCCVANLFDDRVREPIVDDTNGIVRHLVTRC